jgi:hypothetical protein
VVFAIVCFAVGFLSLLYGNVRVFSIKEVARDFVFDLPIRVLGIFYFCRDLLLVENFGC